MHAAFGRITFQINIALHHIKLPVDLWTAARRLNDHETIHAMRKMERYHRRSAMIDVDSRIHGLELKDACRTGRSLGHLASAAWPENTMRVDAVADRAFSGIL